MNLKNLATRIAPAVRSIHTSNTVRSGHDTRSIYGSNVPFPVNNRHALLATFIVYFSSGVSIPFLCLRSMVLDKN